MSYKQLSPAWDADLPCPSKLILISLADQSNDEGICWPGIATLIKRTGLDERSIYRHLASLEKAGHIHREARPGRSNIYHVHPVASVTPDKNVTTTTPDKNVTPDTQSPIPLTHSHPTPDTQSPITVIEPKEEPTTKPSSEKPALDVGFEKLWTAYPKKIGKGAAEKAFKRAKINGHLPEVLAALDKQKVSAQWTKDGGQYIPNPSTWINQKRWLDEPAHQEQKQTRDWI